jgi:hypothetical protein
MFFCIEVEVLGVEGHARNHTKEKGGR